MQRSNPDNKQLPYKQLKELILAENIGKEPINYTTGEVVKNPSLFLNSHFKVIEANSGKKCAYPYYKRLMKFYNYIIQNKR